MYKYYILIVWKSIIVFDDGKVLELYKFLNVMWLNNMYYILILPVDQNVGTCLVKLGSTCAPLQPPSSAKIHLKNLQKNRAALLRPIALQRPSQWPNHQILRAITLKNSQGTVQCSLSQYAQELASVKSIIWTCVPRKFVGKPFYTWSLSLSRQLQTWTRGSHPVVHMPSSGASLTWALLLTLFWLSYLCMVLPSA